jgi:hypothetical protein
MVKLTLTDRYDLGRYSGSLPCTIDLRRAIDPFQAMLAITPEEWKEFNVSIDPTTFELTCLDDTYTVEYKEFPAPVIAAMKSYIEQFDHDATKNNVMLQSTFEAFRKII